MYLPTPCICLNDFSANKVGDRRSKWFVNFSVDFRLNPPHLILSVLYILDNENLPIRIFYLLFRDYLLDPETRDKPPF
ncbi:wd40 protein [Penicillium vulpinum]|uniref:wd40 protein n=1 Tax=Penicillium vulpinum TaxID=29845 RepID=UPI002547EC26|nr:wd40 protein [Penicillium vulpinum]KAJ5972562.1 wd40 protein [Penicillium vulpinum]